MDIPIHDWSFVDLKFSWQSGEVDFYFIAPGGNVSCIHASGVEKLELTRLFEWGESKSVNEAKVVVAEDGSKILEIEIQSGDRIRLVIQDVIWSDQVNNRETHPNRSL